MNINDLRLELTPATGMSEAYLHLLFHRQLRTVFVLLNGVSLAAQMNEHTKAHSSG